MPSIEPYSYQNATLCYVFDNILPVSNESSWVTQGLFGGYGVREVYRNYNGLEETNLGVLGFVKNTVLAVSKAVGLESQAQFVGEIPRFGVQLLQQSRDPFKRSFPKLSFIVLPIMSLISKSTSSLSTVASTVTAYLFYQGAGYTARELIFEPFCSPYVDPPVVYKKKQVSRVIPDMKFVSQYFKTDMQEDDGFRDIFDLSVLHDQLDLNNMVVGSEVPLALVSFLSESFESYLDPDVLDTFSKLNLNNKAHRNFLFQNVLEIKKQYLYEHFIDPIVQQIVENQDSYPELERELSLQLDGPIQDVLKQGSSAVLDKTVAQDILNRVETFEANQRDCLEREEVMGPMLSFLVNEVNTLMGSYNCERSLESELLEVLELEVQKRVQKELPARIEEELSSLFSYFALEKLFRRSDEDRKISEQLLIEFLSFVPRSKFDDPEILFREITFSDSIQDLEKLRKKYSEPASDPFQNAALCPILRITETKGVTPFDLSEPLIYSDESKNRIGEFLFELYSKHVGKPEYVLLSLWLSGIKVRS